MNEDMVYVAKEPGMPGFAAICVDRPEWKDATAKTIAEWVRDGYAVERVTLETGRDGMTIFLQARRLREHAR